MTPNPIQRLSDENMDEKTAKNWRFVIAEIKNSQNPAKQIPLPCSLNGIRVLHPGFDIDRPLVVPYIFISDVAGMAFSDGWVRNKKTKQLDFKGDNYDFRILELPEEYQKVQEVLRLIKALNEGENVLPEAVEHNWDLRNVAWGLDSVPGILFRRDSFLNNSASHAEKMTSKNKVKKLNAEAKKAYDLGLDAAEDSLPRDPPKNFKFEKEWLEGYDAFSVREV